MGGFKCFRRKVLEKIELNKFISKGFIFQAEFIYRTVKKGFAIKEIPIIFEERKSGKSKKTTLISLEALFKTIVLRFLC